MSQKGAGQHIYKLALPHTRQFITIPINHTLLTEKHSNGIRFSITDLSPETARILPTLYTSRSAISLYDAQYSPSGERIPIPANTISTVTSALSQFKQTCADFEVPDDNIAVLATEATRTAINSLEYRQAIKDATGWEVTLLAKEEEGRVGAMGVASSLDDVSGLMMDLGGGSTQLTWLMRDPISDAVTLPKMGAVSMPFGAAALTRGLAEADKEGHGARQRFADSIKARIRDAYASVAVPVELENRAKERGGFTLYLSGGGFRGWGFVLLSQHSVSPYPIPAINGFRASRADFIDTGAVQATVANTDPDVEEGIFRVSQRRASQVPAVAFLVSALAEALPLIKEVRFCQGGVREGYLFSSLPATVQAQSALEVATRPYASPSSDKLAYLLDRALPPPMHPERKGDIVTDPRSFLSRSLIAAFANLLTHFSTHPKDLRAAAALRSTTTGLLAPVHGLAHEDRVALALLLLERWGGVKSLPSSDAGFAQQLQALLDPWYVWWIKYLGRVAALLGTAHPAGVVGKGRGDLEFPVECRSGWTDGEKGKDAVAVNVRFSVSDDWNVFEDEIKAIEKVGKRKNWIGGKHGAGWEVVVGARSRSA